MSEGQAIKSSMQGAGFYNKHSTLQSAGIELALPHLASAARAVPIGAAENFVVADYGASQGRNSMRPMRLAIDTVRTRVGLGHAIEVVHTDLPSNDFSSLFKSLEEDPDSYLAGQKGVYASAIGRSYFDPILPPGRVNLGWNSWTLHWLSQKTVDAPDHVFAGFSAKKETRDAAKRRGAEDWSRFLQARSSELRPGGKVVSLFVGEMKDQLGWEWVGREFWQTLCEIKGTHKLSEEEKLRITFPVAPRTADDVKTPFAGGNFAGLGLEHCEVVPAPDPFWEEYQETHDAVKLGTNWANMMRAVFGPSTAAGLDPGRDRDATLDAIFAEFAKRIAATPQKHIHFIALAVIAKPD